MKSRFASAPLFAQVMGLVLLSLLAAPVTSGIMLFSLPPPSPDAYRLSELEGALRRPGTYPVADGPPLMVRYATSPPEGRQRLSPWNEGLRISLAAALGIKPEDILIRAGNRRRGPAIFEQRLETHIRMGHFPGPPPLPSRHAPWMTRRLDERLIIAPFAVAVRQPDGRWLVARPQQTFRWDAWPTRVILTLVLSVFLIAPIAWLFAKRLAAPLSVLAKAADRLGRDPASPPLEMAGSSEIKAAARAFNQMQERLRRYVDDRTAMVGAIAHDLRTPLTRLRFRIESAPDGMKEKMASDIDQMEAMIAATLGFVSDATRPGVRTPMELASLVESVLDEAAETGAKASIEQADRLVIEADPVALRRMITNLVDNALKYGGAARARVYEKNGNAIIEIDDDGPGIPQSDADRIFDPFFRGEPSRSRETGGIGLGLAVVRSVARAHGGDATVVNRPDGGATARVSLPL
jgi:two-component system OmpR family sensor kinase